MKKLKSVLFLSLFALTLTGCSTVTILNPSNGDTFAAGQNVAFEGQLSRSTQTGGSDRSDELVWSSNQDGNLGTGRAVSTSSLSSGSHKITARWGTRSNKDSINISVN